jgi:hypothetical protein
LQAVNVTASASAIAAVLLRVIDLPHNTAKCAAETSRLLRCRKHLLQKMTDR